MGCCSSTANVPSNKATEDERVQMSPVTAHEPVAEEPLTTLSQPPNRTPSSHQPTHGREMTQSPEALRRVMSDSPQPSSSSSKIQRANSVQAGSSASRRQVLTPTVQKVLSNPSKPFKFRILVVGKKGSGKSSLVNTVFKVNISAAPGTAPGKPDINHGIHPKDNCYLIVHEYPAFEPGDVQGLQVIREFISSRTDPNRSDAEKLHAVWICVPTSDAINGSIGEGVEEILNMGRVPVVVAFTKFDVVILIEGRNSQDHENARAKADARYKASCRSLFGKDPGAVPAEIVQVNSQLGDLIDDLVVRTDRLIMGTPSSEKKPKTRIPPIRLAWSAALRTCRAIIIGASIEVGRSRYWCDLRSGRNFIGQSLKNCMDVVHVDIVEIWNLNDGAKYLSSTEFKEKMSHIVNDLAGPGRAVPSGSRDNFPEWVDDIYRPSPENIQCLMGYIVDLNVILNDICRTTLGSVSANYVQQVMDRHVRSGGPRDAIHHDISNFITANKTLVPQGDMVLEQIMDLIWQYCGPLSPTING